MEVTDFNFDTKIVGKNNELKSLVLVADVTEDESFRTEDIINKHYKEWIKGKGGILRPEPKLEDIKSGSDSEYSNKEIREINYDITDIKEDKDSLGEDKLIFRGNFPKDDVEMTYTSNIGPKSIDLVSNLFTELSPSFVGDKEKKYERVKKLTS